MASSKTARKSTPTNQAGKFQPDAGASRIIPLNEGKHAYVFASNGKLKHVAVGSAEFMEAICAYATDLGKERVLRDIRSANQPSWAEIPALLEAALAPAAAE
jgi:hypothetical protein